MLVSMLANTGCLLKVLINAWGEFAFAFVCAEKQKLSSK